MDPKRAELIQRILAAKQAAGDAIVGYVLETALAEALTPEHEEIAAKQTRQLANMASRPCCSRKGRC